MLRLRKKTIALTTAGFVLAGGGAAFAYWTTTGAGDGSAQNASTASGSLELSAGWEADQLAPGVSLPVTITATNNDANTDQFVGTVSKSAVTADAAHPGCAVADLSFAPVAINQVVPAGGSSTFATTGTLVYANTGVDQGGCKGATITLSLSSN